MNIKILKLEIKKYINDNFIDETKDSYDCMCSYDEDTFTIICGD